MSDYYISQDLKKCVGCHCCEVQCKANKNLPAGINLCRIVTVGPEMVGGLPRTSFVYTNCLHCERPLCMEACKVGAIKRREEDGIVLIDEELCVGCKLCVKACLWGAPQFSREDRKVVKCDLCVDRIDNGEKPACVTTCMTGALSFGDANELTAVKRERHAASVASPENSAY